MTLVDSDDDDIDSVMLSRFVRATAHVDDWMARLPEGFREVMMMRDELRDTNFGNPAALLVPPHSHANEAPNDDDQHDDDDDDYSDDSSVPPLVSHGRPSWYGSDDTISDVDANDHASFEGGDYDGLSHRDQSSEHGSSNRTHRRTGLPMSLALGSSAVSDREPFLARYSAVTFHFVGGWDNPIDYNTDREDGWSDGETRDDDSWEEFHNAEHTVTMLELGDPVYAPTPGTDYVEDDATTSDHPNDNKSLSPSPQVAVSQVFPRIEGEPWIYNDTLQSHWNHRTVDRRGRLSFHPGTDLFWTRQQSLLNGACAMNNENETLRHEPFHFVFSCFVYSHCFYHWTRARSTVFCGDERTPRARRP